MRRVMSLTRFCRISSVISSSSKTTISLIERYAALQVRTNGEERVVVQRLIRIARKLRKPRRRTRLCLLLALFSLDCHSEVDFSGCERTAILLAGFSWLPANHHGDGRRDQPTIFGLSRSYSARAYDLVREVCGPLWTKEVTVAVPWISGNRYEFHQQTAGALGLEESGEGTSRSLRSHL